MAEEQNKIVRHLTYVEQGEQGQPNTTVTYDIGTDAEKVKYNNTTVKDYLDNLPSGGGGSSGSNSDFDFNNNNSILISHISQSDPTDPSTKTSSIQQSSFKIGETTVDNTNPYKEDFAKLLNDFNQLKTNFDKFTNNTTGIGKFIGSDTHEDFIVTSDWWFEVPSATQIKLNCRYGNGRKVNIKVFNYTKQKTLLDLTNVDLGTSTYTRAITVSSSTFASSNTIDLTITSAESAYTVSTNSFTHHTLTVGQAISRFFVKWSRKGGAASTKNIMNTSLLDLFYPIGSLYMSTADTHPTALFGGTWERIKGRFIFGSYPDNYYLSGNHSATEYNAPYRIMNYGGSIYLPSHNHSMAHTHDLTGPWSKDDGGKVTAYTKTKNRKAVDTHTTKGSSAANTGSTGWGNAGNMPPYYVANIWRRTA